MNVETTWNTALAVLIVLGAAVVGLVLVYAAAGLVRLILRALRGELDGPAPSTSKRIYRSRGQNE